jgi:hypothetical protein
VTIAAAIAAAAGARQAAAIDRVRWMAGCWEQRAGDHVTEEIWMAPAGGMMLGMSRSVAGGTTREFEHLRISARGDTLVYTAIPSGQPSADFRSTGGAPDAVRFENKAHDFPQAIVYRRLGADSLVARIEGPSASGGTRGIDFPMKRVACPGP